YFSTPTRRQRSYSPFPYTTLFRSAPARREEPPPNEEGADGTADQQQGGWLRDGNERDARPVDVQAVKLPVGVVAGGVRVVGPDRSEEHTSELQSPYDLVCRLLLAK